MTEKDDSKQIAMMKHMVALAEKQTAFSERRSEMSETRSYLNAERTLSVWIRTALALMIFGLAIDRFGLLLGGAPGNTRLLSSPSGLVLDRVSAWTSIALVLLGIFMAAATGLRFLAYARTWQRRHELPAHHGPYLAPFFAAMVALFGVLLLGIMVTAVG